MEQEDDDSNIDELLLDWSGEMRSIHEGDPVTNGIGVISVLPSRFGVNLTAVYDTCSGYYSYGFPLTLGHYNVCENGSTNGDPVYGPRIQWWDDGRLMIYFDQLYDFDTRSTLNDLYLRDLYFLLIPFTPFLTTIVLTQKHK